MQKEQGYPEQGYPPPPYPPQTNVQPMQYPPQHMPLGQIPLGQIPAGQLQHYSDHPTVVQVVQQPMSHPPPTNSVLAWISCLCFCWPLGIVAILKANEADKRIGRGDFEGAKMAGESAKKWAIAAIITAIAISAIIGIIYAILVGTVLSGFANAAATTTYEYYPNQ